MKLPVFKKAMFQSAYSHDGLYDPEKAISLMAPIWEAEIKKQFPSEVAKLKNYKHKVHFFMFVGMGSSLCTLTQIFNGFVYKVDVMSTGRNVREFWWSPNVVGFVKLPSMTFNERSVADAISEAWANNQPITEALFEPQMFEELPQAIQAYIAPDWKLDLNKNQGMKLGFHANKKMWKIAEKGVRIAFNTPAECWEFVKANAVYHAECLFDEIHSAASKFKF